MITTTAPGTPTKAVFNQFALPPSVRWFLEKAAVVINSADADMVQTCWNFSGRVPFRMLGELRAYFRATTGQQWATGFSPLSTSTASVLIQADFPTAKGATDIVVRFQAYFTPGHAGIA